MKKIMRFLSVAALALVGAVMTGCTNDDNIIDQRQQPENKSNVVTLTTTIGLDEEAEARGANRALAIDFTEKKATKTFDVGETMAIVYKDIYGNTVKAVSAALTAGDIASGSKSATFTFELADPDRTKDVTYIYPAAMATDAGAVNYDALATQDGTLATLSTNLDLATYTGAWTGDTSLPAATLDNQLAILALTLKNSTGASIITSGLKQVTVSDGTNTYTVTPTGSTFGTEVIYAAIRPVTAPLTFTATNGTNYYTKTATSRAYAAGDFFNLGLRMTQVYPFTVSVTGGVAKKVLFSPGNLQAKNTTANATTGWTWSFAAHQYDYIGKATANTAVGNNLVTTAGTVDLFGWVGNTSSLAAYGINVNNTETSYGNSTTNTLKSDWGTAANAASLGGYTNWRTPTSAEWTYVFNTRSTSTVNGTANARYTKATVASKPGVILFPDAYTHPSGVTAPAGINNENTNFTANSYNVTEWTKMEAAGAVFLPAAGYRDGTTVYNPDLYGMYWSSTAYNASNAYRVNFASSYVSPASNYYRYYGYSVRLVRAVE